MQQQKLVGFPQCRKQSMVIPISCFLLFCIGELVSAARTTSYRLYRRAQDSDGSSGGGGGGLPVIGIIGIAAGGVAVAGVVGLFTYRYMRSHNRRPHGARIVGMRGAGAMNLQGKMAVLPDDDFHIGTQQGVVGYDSNLEKPPRAARPMSWYKAREAGVSPLHIQAMSHASPGIHQEGPLEDSDQVMLYSPGGLPQVQVAGSGTGTVPQVPTPEPGLSHGRPLPPTPSHAGGQHLHQPHHYYQQLETPIEGPMGSGDRLMVRQAESVGHISEVEWDSDDDEEAATAPKPGTLHRAPSAKFISDPVTDVNDPDLPSHPRLFMLTPGRDGIQALRQPENWSRTTFQLHLLCEGTAKDYSEAHLTEEHGIAVRDPNAFLIHAARYTAQTADALIARDDNVFEQTEMFASSSEASEYFELLSDTLRAWYSDQLVTMEEAAGEGHEVDQDLLNALRAQKVDPSATAKQELGRFLSKYDPKNWFGGLRRTRIQTTDSSLLAEVPPERRVRWLCASCASKATQG